MINLVLIIAIICTLAIYYFYIADMLRGPREGDGWFHLQCAKEIKKNKALLQYHEKFFPGRRVPYTYPPLLHILLSLIVGRIPEKMLFLWPVIMNILLGVTIFLVSCFLNYPLKESLLVSTLFLIIPSNIKGNISITPRQLGMLFFFLSILFATLAIKNNSFYLYLISIFLFAVLLLTHRMGVQLISIIATFFIIIFVFYKLNLVIYTMVWLLGGFTIAFVISGGFYKKVLVDHLKRLKLHFKYGSQSGKGKQLGNPFKILVRNPFLLFILIECIFKLYYRNSFSVFTFVLLITTTVIFMVAVFWIWGSGDRHIIFASPITSLLLLDINFADHIRLFGIFSFITLLVALYYIKISYSTHFFPEATFEAYKYLNEKSDCHLVAILPNVAMPSFIYFVNKKIFAYPHDAGAMEFNRLGVKYRLSDHQYIRNLLLKSGVDALLIKKDFPASNLLQMIKFTKVFENNLWQLYEKHK